MEHLSLETLARLVDESPAPEEAVHLDTCAACREELEALRGQTEGLSLLPDVRPPRDGWARLEEALVAEGLMKPARRREARRSGGRWSGGGGFANRGFGGWLQAAAAVILLLAGGGIGFGVSSLGSETGVDARTATLPESSAVSSAVLAALDAGEPERPLSLDEAEALVRVTEEWYRTALMRYRERLEAEEGPGPMQANPMARFAALETLLLASRAAVRESPTDPFLNGLLVNMRAERDATLRGIQATAPGENWY